VPSSHSTGLGPARSPGTLTERPVDTQKQAPGGTKGRRERQRGVGEQGTPTKRPDGLVTGHWATIELSSEAPLLQDGTAKRARSLAGVEGAHTPRE
jgi:hypothetical protein